MSRTIKLLATVALLGATTLAISSPAHAFGDMAGCSATSTATVWEGNATVSRASCDFVNNFHCNSGTYDFCGWVAQARVDGTGLNSATVAVAPGDDAFMCYNGNCSASSVTGGPCTGLLGCSAAANAFVGSTASLVSVHVTCTFTGLAVLQSGSCSFQALPYG